MLSPVPEVDKEEELSQRRHAKQPKDAQLEHVPPSKKDKITGVLNKF